MNNLFNNFIKDVLQMAHEDPPTGNGGSNGNSGTGTTTEGNDEGGNNTESLDTGENTSGQGGNSEESSGGKPKDDGTPKPNVGVGVW